MAEIDYNSIFDGVSIALHRFYPTARVHGGMVKQDLHPGDFIVVPITTSHTAMLGTRMQRSVTFDVIYFPSRSDVREECLDKSHELPDILGTISTSNGDAIHSIGMECTIGDDVLHCTVSYPHFAYTPILGEIMETIQITRKE